MPLSVCLAGLRRSVRALAYLFHSQALQSTNETQHRTIRMHSFFHFITGDLWQSVSVFL